MLIATFNYVKQLTLVQKWQLFHWSLLKPTAHCLIQWWKGQ